MSRVTCKTEGCVNLATSVGRYKDGSTKYGNLCSSCKKKPWQSYKNSCCEHCGFIPEHPCQLDVDHKDGDKNNNDPINYETLCANCHRLKTHRSKEYINRDGAVVAPPPFHFSIDDSYFLVYNIFNLGRGYSISTL